MSMTSTDPIADMLSRIRNAMNVNKHEVSMPHSKAKQAVAEILRANHFIEKVAVADNEGVGKTMTITINSAGENARITEIKRLSTPGRRMYAGADKIPTVKSGRGIVIVSTSAKVL